MYDVKINLDGDEVIQFEAFDTPIEYNEKRINIDIIITNKRIIFLQDINKNTILEARNITRCDYRTRILEPIEEIERKEIQDYHYIETGTEIETDNKNIFIFNYDLTSILK